MKKLIFLCACLLALLALPCAAMVPPEIVVVRIYEGAHTTIILTHGEGKSEKIEIENGVTDKKLMQGSEGYYKVFERLYQEGYTVQSTFSTVYSATVGFTTLLFVKAH
jgi:opacity protein-like surface antigen